MSHQLKGLIKFKEKYKLALPFQENKISDNTFIREFFQDTDSGEFMWHRDFEDRIIESIGSTDWMLQIDNELPSKIEGEIFIPMGAYHRLIKGTGDLKIKLIKKESIINNDIIGKNIVKVIPGKDKIYLNHKFDK